MAHHKSALKRIRSDEKKRDRNRYQHKTARNAVRKLRVDRRQGGLCLVAFGERHA